MHPKDIWNGEYIASLKTRAEAARVAAGEDSLASMAACIDFALWSGFEQGRAYERKEAVLRSTQEAAKTWRHFETTLRVLGDRSGMSADECDTLVKQFEEYVDKQWLDGHGEGYDSGASSRE